MDERQKEFVKQWKKLLIDIGKSESQVAKDHDLHQQSLNRKIQNGSIKYLELDNILNTYGYKLVIVKKGESNNE